MIANKENIKKWVDALRSGRFNQAKEALATKEGFCCLGVACELAFESGVPLLKETTGVGTVEYDGWGGTMPDPVMDWLGVESNNPELEGGACSELNDGSHGRTPETFREIADKIEAKYLNQ